ncbi:DUF1572 family protein [Mucilaginibacter sp.]|uniref:DUF1572 family protein n=1 Tax=Mucilaginibacter sp. TaxID=1882438 RepID=UPI0035BC2880
MLTSLKLIFERDLLKLKTEIELYQNESNIWLINKSISNSAGNLCLHLVGNLNAYIGFGLANINYTRERDLEFSLKDVPRTYLIEKINQTIIVVQTGLNNLDERKMETNFPIVIWEQPTRMDYTLIHLATHLAYHLGQINYHRRLLDD